MSLCQCNEVAYFDQAMSSGSCGEISACPIAVALAARDGQGQAWSDYDRKEFAERHSKLSKELQAALSRVSRSEQALESQKENTVELNAKIISLNAELAESRGKSAALRQAARQSQGETARQKAETKMLRRSLDGDQGEAIDFAPRTKTSGLSNEGVVKVLLENALSKQF